MKHSFADMIFAFFSDGEKSFSVIRPVVLAFILCVAAFAAYFNALDNSFMMDDRMLIFSDPARHHPLQIFNHFLPSHEHGLSAVKDETLGARYFRPWAHALPLLCHAVFKDHVVFYHVFNIFLMAAAGFAVYHLIAMLFEDKRVPFLAALLFMVHPVNGVLVNYVTASALSLMMIFSALSLICAINASRSPRISGPTLIAGVFFYINSVFCHESALMLPAFVMIALGFVHPFNARKMLLISLPYWIFGGMYFVFRMSYASLKSSLFDNAVAVILSPVDHLAAFTKLLVWYLQALFTLKDIVLIKSEAITGGVAWPWIVVFVVLLIAFCLILKFAGRAVRFGALFFAAGFLPVTAACFFQDSAGLILEPHWVLIGSLGFFTAAAAALTSLQTRCARPVRIAIIAFLLGSCLIAGWRYNHLWSDQEIYCEYWAKVSPSLDLPLFFLGDALIEQNRWPEARKAYLAAAEKSRRPFEYYYNVAGIILLEGGDLRQAKDLLIRALAIYPYSSIARITLGMVYSSLDGRDDIAERLFKEAVYFNPHSTDARTRLAELYIGQEKFAQAAAQYESIFVREPENSRLPSMIVEALLKTDDEKQIKESAERFVKVLNDPHRLLEIAVILAQARRSLLAVSFFEKALKKGRNVREVYIESGKFSGNLNDFDGAITIWEEGLRRYPGDQELTDLIRQAELLRRQ